MSEKERQRERGREREREREREGEEEGEVLSSQGFRHQHQTLQKWNHDVIKCTCPKNYTPSDMVQSLRLACQDRPRPTGLGTP